MDLNEIVCRVGVNMNDHKKEEVQGKDPQEDWETASRKTGGRPGNEFSRFLFTPWFGGTINVSSYSLVLENAVRMMLLGSNMFKDAEKCTICSPLIFFFGLN